MSFYKFKSDDIINTSISTFPRQVSRITLNIATGTIPLERAFLVDSTWSGSFYGGSTLKNKRHQGYSERLGGFLEKYGPFSASIEVMMAVSGGTNKELYKSINALYNYHSLWSSDYTITGTFPAAYRVISIPQVYYDKGILTGSFTGSDVSGSTIRTFYDNGRGGLYSGSVSGTLIGNIFYSEGIATLHAADLSTSFGSGTMTFDFKGDHTIPVKIMRCRAPAGELNCSTNPSYSRIKTDVSASNRNEREIIMENKTTYITKVGLYNEHFELIAVASLAHPIRKDEDKDLQIRLRWDW